MIPKFRAWLPTLKWMCNVSAILFDAKSLDVYKMGDTERVTEMSVNQDEVILMQSTGLFDKNGTEIFEGDVVRFGHLFDGFLNRVVWDKDSATFKLEPLETLWSHTYFSNFKNETIKRLEVIGNIYESPKLTEVSDDQ